MVLAAWEAFGEFDFRPIPLSSSATLVARVAVHAVVDISLHASMLSVGVGLAMAVRAREDRVIGRVGVARRAYAVRSAVIRREPGVIERRACP